MEAVQLFESQSEPPTEPEDMEDVQKALESMNKASEFIRKETGFAPALIQFQKDDAEGNFLAHLRVYYQRLFPFKEYYRWLSYGEGTSSLKKTNQSKSTRIFSSTENSHLHCTATFTSVFNPSSLRWSCKTKSSGCVPSRLIWEQFIRRNPRTRRRCEQEDSSPSRESWCLTLT